MKKIEREEENLAYEDPDRKTYHLCIVNLVIGTLYCAKGNYQACACLWVNVRVFMLCVYV